MRPAEARAVTGTPEEFADACLPASNWAGDEWKSRRMSIARMVKARDAEVRRAAMETLATDLRVELPDWLLRERIERNLSAESPK